MAEPVTLAEVKKYIREDDEYTYNDDLLNMLITAERKWMEKYLEIVIVKRSVTEIYRRPCCGQYTNGCYYVKNVPVNGDLVIKDLQNNVEEFTNYGSAEYPQYNFTYSVNLTFDAGYNDGEVPEDLKTALCIRVATAYMQRENFTNEQINLVPNNSMELMRPYSRNVF